MLHSAVSGYKTFRQRELEVVYGAHKIFPCQEEHIGIWQFFDANMTVQRCFGWPPGVDKEGKQKKIKCPWKVGTVPCQTGSAVMAARLVQKDGTTILRRIHGIRPECAEHGKASRLCPHLQDRSVDRPVAALHQRIPRLAVLGHGHLEHDLARFERVAVAVVYVLPSLLIGPCIRISAVSSGVGVQNIPGPRDTRAGCTSTFAYQPRYLQPAGPPVGIPEVNGRPGPRV